MKALAISLALMAAVAAGGLVPAARAGTGDIWVTSNTTLTDDQHGRIFIGASGITLDCAGHEVDGPGSAGITLASVTGVTVKNCRVS